jgi:HD superfamily phosphohydrolase
LSFAYLVYHGAEHSRFGHALGAMHTVDKALQKINKNSQAIGMPINLTEDDTKLARFAALLHDIGHSPFSHAISPPLEDHEKYSAAITDKVFAPVIEKAGVNVKDVTDLILGKPPLDKPFLRSLINSQLDVDKLDYLLRDSHYAGMKYGIFDVERLIDSLLVVDNELVILEGGFYAAEQLILARYHMFEQVYYHRTKRAFENMAKKVAINLLHDNKFKYPSVAELDKDAEIERLVSCNDDWFMNQLDINADHNMQNIIKMIKGRLPFKIVSDSTDISKKIPHEEGQAAGRGFLTAIEDEIKNSMNQIGISESEIIFDEVSNIPYKLRPYTRLLGMDSDEPDVVSIYDRKNGLKTPIERLSLIVKTLATNIFSARRIYADKRKYTLIQDFLKKRHPRYF